MYVFGEDREMLEKEREVFGNYEELLGESGELLGEDGDILGNHWNVFGKDGELLGENEVLGTLQLQLMAFFQGALDTLNQPAPDLGDHSKKRYTLNFWGRKWNFWERQGT